jgi:3',5'-cyclic AMP phosphodiesterase CpdA
VIDWGRTVHGVGDLHAGEIAADRLATVLDDVRALPTPALHLQIGDATEHGRADEDEIALDWLARLPGPHGTILGNHDILHDRRTPGRWARAYGRRSKNFVVDLGFVRILAVGPDRNHPEERAGLLTPRTLAWLERELERSPDDCWIACHWPLSGTVLGDPRRLFTSEMTSFHAKPDRELRALLARHRNAKAWLSGHTHSPLSAPGFVTRAPLPRRRTILAVNLSAVLGIGKTPEPSDPVRSVYLTHRPDAIEVRFRDHRSRGWVAVGGRRVVRARV